MMPPHAFFCRHTLISYQPLPPSYWRDCLSLHIWRPNWHIPELVITALWEDKDASQGKVLPQLLGTVYCMCWLQEKPSLPIPRGHRYSTTNHPRTFGLDLCLPRLSHQPQWYQPTATLVTLHRAMWIHLWSSLTECKGLLLSGFCLYAPQTMYCHPWGNIGCMVGSQGNSKWIQPHTFQHKRTWYTCPHHIPNNNEIDTIAREAANEAESLLALLGVSLK